MAVVNGVELSPEDLRGFRAVFDLVDDDKSGAIDAREVAALMDLLGMPSNDKEQVDVLVKEIDREGDGVVDFDEFLLVVAGGNRRLPFTRRELLGAFAEVPTPNATPRGRVQVSALARFLARHCEGLSSERARRLASFAAPDENGFVDYVERVKTLANA